MNITFRLSGVFSPSSTQAEDASVLKAAMEFLIAADLAYLKARPPGSVLPLYQAGVRYVETDDWLSIPDLFALRYGDCKSLAACLIAQYRSQGIQAMPVFRWNQRQSGYKDYHILVQLWDGSFEDPSRELGMR